MIPGWSEYDGLDPEARYGVDKPTYHSLNPYTITLGPEALNDSQGTITNNFWLFEQEASGDVIIQRYNDGVWEEPSVLFNTERMVSLSGTFDQLGKPLVFYSTEDGLTVWWYNSTIEEHVSFFIGDGHHPYAILETPWYTSNPDSDIIILYIRDGGIYYRVQRDSYATEYASPATSGVLKILQAYTTNKYRLQLIYTIG